MRYLALFLILLPVFSSAQNERSLSPYFSINVDSGQAVPDFPLQSTSADVEIAGVMADVTVTQVYINHSDRVLEAVYVFPGSTNAAVYAMQMKIGRRVIEAEIREKEQARQEYDEAKQTGHTASLLEQERPNIFTMSVANIMPGDSIIVQMSYTEKLIPTNGTYEFVYPTVVAPRYTGAGAPPVASLSDVVPLQEGIPYTKKGIDPLYQFGINISIASAVPFEFIKSTTHKVLLEFGKENTATVLLDPSEKDGGNRDFILQYRFAGGQIETGLMLYEGKEENFFMLMMQPPKRVTLDSIPPREYIFVMDVSGSMSGYPLTTSKNLLKNLVGGLRPTDKFNVVQFAGGAALFSEESVDANTANVDSALAFIDHVQAGGGTELNEAMRTAMFIPEQQGYSRSIIIVTDGMIDAESNVLRSMRNHLDSANVFAFGIGSSANRYLIEAMAFCGDGEPFVVTRAEDADSAAAAFRQYISSPVLTHISVQYHGFDVYETDPAAVPDLFADRPLVITGKYHGKAIGKIVVTGNTGAGPYREEISVDSVRPRKQNKAIRLLWARERVKYLSYLDYPGGYYSTPDVDTSVQKQIKDLGLKYGLLTNYTSFIAVDRRVRNKNLELDSSVTEPLPLPQGVDNEAVGMNGASISTVVITGQRDIVTCVPVMECMSSAACVSLPVQPEFLSVPGTMEGPATIGDISRFYNNGIMLPLITFNGNPFFTPGASARMISSLPVSMVGSYSTGAGSVDGGYGNYAPLNSGSFSFGYYNPKRIAVSTGINNYGAQDLSAISTERFGQHFTSIFEIAEQWKGSSTDRNADGFRDNTSGYDVCLHHRITGYTSSDSSLFSRMWQNEIYFHSSSRYGGSNSFSTHDNAMGLFVAPRVLFQVNSLDYLYLNSSFAVAGIDDDFGIDRFHLHSVLGSINAYYEHFHSNWTFAYGVTGNISSGEEQWNTIHRSDAQSTAAGYCKARYNRNNLWLSAGFREEYQSDLGFAALPSVLIGNSWDELSIWLIATGYRSQPVSLGQLLPIMYSTREIQFPEKPVADQGWSLSAAASYSRGSDWHWSIDAHYNLIIPSQTVVVDADMNESLTAVYAVDHGPIVHRITVQLELKMPGHFILNGNYAFSYCPIGYESRDMQQMLTPLNRIITSLQWKSPMERWFAQVEGTYTDRQRLGVDEWSPAFATMNVHARYKLRSGHWEFFLGVYDVFDYRQQHVVTETQDNMDAWKVWGPVTGRTIHGGVTLSF